MVVDDQEKHRYCTNKFIELANQLKDEQIDTSLVSGALMTASGIYATFVAAGNQGALEPSGVDKVVAIYRRTLEHHQDVKKARSKQNES
jgi:DNA-binding NtrC family response regulator